VDRIDRDRIEKVLRRIPAAAWKTFIGSREGLWLRRRIRAVDAALEELPTAMAKPGEGFAARIADLLGYSLMQDPHCGPWIREQLLRKAARPTWERLLESYRSLSSRKTVAVRRNASRAGKVPSMVAAYWLQGGNWGKVFCEAFGLPDGVWQRREARLPEDEDVIPSEPLPSLHDYQRSAYDRLRRLLTTRARGRTALLSLPTGAGKTRVIVEAICDHLAETAEEGTSGVVLWIAHSTELQLQAWECFREVWQVPPQRTSRESPIRRVQPLRLVRLWGSRNPETIEDGAAGPEILIASIDQLASWLRRDPSILERIRSRNLLCAVIDEAHGVITSEFRHVLEALGLKVERRWLPKSDAPLLIGITATPWRKSDVQDASLHRFFSNLLVTSGALGSRPVQRLQARGILSNVEHDRIRIDEDDLPFMNSKQRGHVMRFHDLPAEFLEQLAHLATRNREILRRLLRLKVSCKTLVFACSIEHAETLAACLNSAIGPGVAVAVTSATPRAERSLVIEQFRAKGGTRFLCTVGVLAAGFDAPKVGAVVITRPTMSAALYEQMVGRGLRGPKNGGTESCRVIDVQDEGLPDGVLSYARVIERWTIGKP
jgi:DNA repair protein RadD